MGSERAASAHLGHTSTLMQLCWERLKIQPQSGCEQPTAHTDTPLLPDWPLALISWTQEHPGPFWSAERGVQLDRGPAEQIAVQND